MTITVRYMAQLKQAAGVGTEQVVVDGECLLQDLVQRVANEHGEALRKLLLDGQGNLQPTILLFVGDEQVEAADKVKLKEGDVVTFLSPIAGG